MDEPLLLRFAVPSSLGQEIAGDRARRLTAFLTEALRQPVKVVVPGSYEELSEALLRGRLDAAWTPPFVSARLEASGVRIALRAVRRGHSTFRAALVARAGDPLTLQTLSGRTVAWVEPHSTGGYLLPLAHLKMRGITPRAVGLAERFTGSYRAALEAVLEGRADMASIFAPPVAAGGTLLDGLEEVLPGRSGDFALVSDTEEVPNDAVAVSPVASAEVTAALERVLLELHRSGQEALLRETFHAERFEPSPPQGFRSLYRVALAGL